MLPEIGEKSKNRLFLTALAIGVVIAIAIILNLAGQSSHPYMGTVILLVTGLVFVGAMGFGISFFMKYDPDGGKKKKNKTSGLK